MDGENRTRYEWLALRCQSGEPGAFEDLIAVLERPLLYYATSLTGNKDSGLDVLQEVWIKAFRGIRGLKEPGSLRSWLYSITHGIAVDRIRRNSSREQAEKVQLDNSPEAEFGNFFWPICGGLNWPTLGRCSLGKVFASPSRKNKDRRRSCGNVGIPPLWRDFQGRWEEWETVLGFSTLSTARHFHS